MSCDSVAKLAAILCTRIPLRLHTRRQAITHSDLSNCWRVEAVALAIHRPDSR